MFSKLLSRQRANRDFRLLGEKGSVYYWGKR
jgi:hypothetical protein